MQRNPRLLVGTLLVTSVLATQSAWLGAAYASGGAGVTGRGDCSGWSTWTLNAKHGDGRLEVEAEVNAVHTGRTFTWTLDHNGSRSASGSKVTAGRSASFTVHASMVNLRGTDSITFRAHNARTGERCTGTVRT